MIFRCQLEDNIMNLVPYMFYPLHTIAAVDMAESNSDCVVGVVCRKRLSNQPHIIHMTPG